MLAAVTGVSIVNYMDRTVMAVLVEPIKDEFGVSDAAMGALTGLAFALLYATAGLPISRFADRGMRVRVISIAMTFWSVMTIFCGLALNYWQLLLARLGVGAGESGGSPPSQALVAEYFPIEQRSRALAVFVVGAHIGTFIGMRLGGYIGDEYGWRTAFLMLGAPGVLFALLVWATVREPPKAPSAVGAESALQGGVVEASIHLLRGHSFRNLMLGTGILWFSNMGAVMWHAPFLSRTHGVPLAEVGALLSWFSVPNMLAVLVGGFVADQLSRRDPRWLVYVPLLATAVSLPFLFGFYLLPSLDMAFISALVAMFAAGMFSPVLVAASLSLAGPHARTLTGALINLSATLIGMGLGPFVTGVLSDQLTPALGPEALRWSLVVMKLFPLWAIYHLWLASRTFVDEMREAGAG